ncbi:hypothetical protein [Engelhardtia mirabilis]|uniref:Uncharacterized protein n=1 Tax=Engelhardtia mirabilis TaxID=2528011 RepID=A0A518BKC2_9BACT|nr:hypothetical protein Pla133_25040 [Planctomycetes bacterium Pla133]QDV01747.1 hypothetical protein Pla86_25030 [Planctomycetes bacterium Pla86]
MQNRSILRKARLLAIPALLAGMVSAAQNDITSSPCAFEKGKCYKLTYHPT